MAMDSVQKTLLYEVFIVINH